MAGTVEGGRKAAKTNKEKYGNGFYAEIGAKGGRNSHTGGFAANPELARIAGAKGGKASSRAGVKNGDGAKKTGPKPKTAKQKRHFWLFGGLNRAE